MDKHLGGRGKKAPYDTTHTRVPVPIKDRVETLKSLYVSGELDSYDENIRQNQELADKYRNLLTSKDEQALASVNNPVNLETALSEAKNILNFKQSAKKTVIKLLTALYGTQITEDDLKL